MPSPAPNTAVVAACFDACYGGRALDVKALFRHLGVTQVREASWRSGDVEDCKSSHPGSIPGEASNSLDPIDMVSRR